MRGVFRYFFLLLICSSACNLNDEIVPIQFGKDQCSYCRMTISNPKFGAELITDKGRVLKYDAAECMVNHINKESPEYKRLYAIAYDAPKKLYPVDSLHFLISPDIRSPMGANLSAYDKKRNLDESYHSMLIDWNTLLNTL